MRRLRETANLMQAFSCIIADNDCSTRISDKMELVYLYPLHKPQVLQWINSASGRDLKGFYGNVFFDSDFKEALTSAGRRIVASAANEDDILNLLAILEQISCYDQAEALTLAQQIQQKVASGEIPGEKAKDFAQYALDIVAEGAGYVASLQDSDLVGILKGDQCNDVKKDAFLELLRRGNPEAINLVSKSPEDLVSEKTDCSILRQIYVQKLLGGDFTSWAKAFTIGDETAIRQAELSISEACRAGSFDTTNPEFVNALRGFNDDSFFSTIRYIIDANLPLDELLHQEAQRRLIILLSNVRSLDETTQELVYPEKYIHFLCQEKTRTCSGILGYGNPCN
jgi:hypothetical protein